MIAGLWSLIFYVIPLQEFPPMRYHTPSTVSLIKSAFALTVVLLFSACQSKQREALLLLERQGVASNVASLHRFAYEGNVEIVRALLINGVSPDGLDQKNQTPLMVAAGQGQSKVVALLLEKTQALDHLAQDGENALSCAVDSGDLVTVTELLGKGASAISLDGEGESLLVKALRDGKLAIFYSLLEAGANVEVQSLSGDTLAELALKNGQISILHELKKRGVDFAGEKEGELLHLACQSEQLDALKFLLDEGLDANARDDNGDSLLHAALSRGWRDVLSLLAEKGADFEALSAEGLRPVHLALLTRDTQLLEAILRTGVRLDQKSGRGQGAGLPLDWALDARDFAAARLLLRYGAPRQGMVYRAMSMGGRDEMEFLDLALEFGAPVNPAMIPFLDTPLEMAMRSGNRYAIKRLLRAGASVHAPGLTRQEPLALAVAMDDESLVAELLNRGANVNSPCCRPVNDDFLNLVKTKGVAKWALQKTSAVTPLMLAADSGNINIAQLLIKNGAVQNITTRFGGNRMWPLSFATRREDVEMMQVLLGRAPSRDDRWLKVDLSEQRVWLYKNGDEIVYTTRISTGKKGYRTPAGEYVITNKYRDWTSSLYDAQMPWFQRLSTSDFGFHQGNVPGYAASHGCMRVPNGAAHKLYQLTEIGDYVQIVP